MIEMCQSYYANPTEYKRQMIVKWKGRGVVYPDFNDLYDIYMNTLECQHCHKPFETSHDRCLDHNHETGLFRMILCQGCNNQDSFLKYSPDLSTKEKRKVYHKEYREQNRDKIFEQRKEYREQNKEVINMKLNCFFCSKQMSRKSLGRHFYDGHCIIKPLKTT
jgi:hypothetical protein